MHTRRHLQTFSLAVRLVDIQYNTHINMVHSEIQDSRSTTWNEVLIDYKMSIGVSCIRGRDNGEQLPLINALILNAYTGNVLLLILKKSSMSSTYTTKNEYLLKLIEMFGEKKMSCIRSSE